MSYSKWTTNDIYKGTPLIKAGFHFVLVLTWLGISFPILGSEQLREAIPVQVTSIFEKSAFLNKGTSDGVEVGNRVTLRSKELTFTARVSSVARRESRCELESAESLIEVGCKGEVFIRIDGIKRLPKTEDIDSVGLADVSIDDVSPNDWLPSVTFDGSDTEAPQTSIGQASNQRRNNGRSSNPVQPISFQSEGPGGVIRVDVRVTASSGGDIFLDKGTAASIQPGDEVVLYPPGEGIVNATIQSVSKSSSRSTVLSGTTRIDIGTRGEVLVLEARLSASGERSQDSPGQGSPPEHPPWSHQPEEWDDSKPLLAPAHSRTASEREPEMHGRVFGNYMHTWNRSPSHNQYFLGRVGTAMWLENLMRRGGSFQLFGEFNARGVLLGNGFEDVDSPGRLDRISYSRADSLERPVRFEFGRFFSHEFPEFGIIDGAEFTRRTESGNRLGISVGFLPEPFPNLKTGDDFQVAAFYRLFADADDSFSTGVGYQRTWHKGTPDRDLLIYTMDYHPGTRLLAHGTVWTDFYDARDAQKSTNYEITQAIGNVMYRLDTKRGLGAHVSHVRWPQLFRREFSPFIDEQIINGRVFRYGLFAWHELSPRTRLDGRVDQWSDQDEEHGSTWEGRISLRDLFFKQSELAFAVYGTDGIHSSGPGGRVSAYRYFPRCVVSVSYDATDYQILAASSRFIQHYVRSNLDFTLGSGRSVTLFSDYRFGDSQKAFQLGLFIQKRL